MAKKSKVALDPTTNMPAVPENYFWLVTITIPYQENIPTLYVELCRKKFLGSKAVAIKSMRLSVSYDDKANIPAEDATFYWTERGGGKVKYKVPIDPSEYESKIVPLAVEVLDKFELDHAVSLFRERVKAERKRLGGKYPPKRLSS